ncbi:MAG: LuxR C-terminal-related transcriptional regulator [Oscillospiraceae bacterium]|jgi:LuxR family maltose regulon positive regulatory protein|nr:LuxR C-terminal-related transcriptional regulator [Oscillospiraceae bacterium]
MKTHIFHNEAADLPENRTYLERPRVHKLLEEAIKSPYVTVTAGAGYGKTHAVYSFLRNYDASTAWIQLSQRDNLATRFWESFARTLGLYSKRVAERLRELGFPETDDQFANMLSIPDDELAPGEKYVLVFDDLHFIEDEMVLRFIKRAAQVPFQNITMVLISRVNPDINTVSLLSKGLLVNINEDELRFTEEETAQYFQLLGLNLSSQSVANVYSDTLGWAFAINLVGLSLKKAPSHERDARIAMKLNIFKMIEDEIFLVISERLRLFLVRLSLIDHLSSDLVSILAGDETLVDEMKKVSSFIRYDIYLSAYLIHHLFLDYLRQKQDILTEEEKRDTYLKAADWCNANDYQTDAISYYDKAGDYKAIVRIAHRFPLQIPFEQAKFVLNIYDNAPVEQLEPIVHYHSQRSRLLMSMARYDEAAAEIKERIRKFSALPASGANNQILCGAYKELGIIEFLMSPYTDCYDFDLTLKKANDYFMRSPYDVQVAFTSISLNTWASKVSGPRQGAMEDFIAALTRAIPHAMSTLDGCMYGLDDLAKGELLFYKGSLKAAETSILQALRKAETRNQYEIRNRSLFYLLRIKVAQGNFEKIQTLLNALEQQLEIGDYTLRFTSYDIVSSWYYSLLGQPQLAANWLKGNFTRDSIGALIVGFGNFIKTKYYYADKRYHELLSFIEDGHGTDAVLLGKLEMKALEAACHYQLKDTAAALAALRAAYDLASSNDLVMPFVERGKDMRTLTAAAMRDDGCDIPRPWLEMIHRKAATYAKRLAQVISEYKRANNINDDVHLSPRETAVLNDLYHGLSRTEIAASQNLSINTVKMVLNTIYTKLGADNMADVVRAALERKLIP